jgi:hypothetical protein
MPKDGYLAATVSDLRRLPSYLQSSAILIDVGEVSWPIDQLRSAANHLADLGVVLRGLDRDVRDDDGRLVLAGPIELYEGDDIEESRRIILEGISHLRAGERGVVVWQCSSAG